jgi:lipopolysaccharide biosynthesis regulator YciM
MNWGQFLLLVVILGAILAFVGIPWWMARRRETVVWDPTRSYLAAIDALIRGDRGAAVAPLRELARNETENIGPYLRLGDLVRRMGYPDRAHRVHVDLLARPIEDPEDLRRVHESLLEDLLLLDRPEDTKRIADALLAIDRKNPIALRALERYHEGLEDWARALDLLDDWDRSDPGKTMPTPAQMRIEVARRHLTEGKLKEAEKLLQEAVKMADGALAKVFLGDLRAQQGDVEGACEEWVGYLRGNGYRSDQVFARLERAYFEMGRFGDLMRVYEDLAAGRSGSLHAVVALADMHRRRGRLEESVRQLESVIEQEPDNRNARRQMIGGLFQIGRTEQAMRELDALLSQVAPDGAGEACPSCGAQAADLWVRCERCNAWLEPVRSAPPPRPRSVFVPHAD